MTILKFRKNGIFRNLYLRIKNFIKREKKLAEDYFEKVREND